MKYSLKVDQSKVLGELKPMNAVNNGPVRAPQAQKRGNFETYAAAGFPYARLHDANLCYSYGGPHVVDINAIFPNFDADENDPASYDFVLTDLYLSNIVAAGTKVFYRLGQSIEHWGKKYDIFPPKDFHKWARICEHIILHYNEGWANGFHFDIEYWEIWNEPDLDPGPHSPCWQGTKEEFFDLFEIAVKYLKGKFPHLKIGGPASAGFRTYAVEFLAEMEKRGVPLDFYSWHNYDQHPHHLGDKSVWLRELLDSHGYTKTESILNEWNYVRDWIENWVYSLRAMQGLKGASFATAVMCVSQDKPIDMLMYYEARIGSAMNGLFDLVSLEPLKTYYSYLTFHEMTKLGKEVASESDSERIYSLAVSNGRTTEMLVTYYEEDDDTPPTELSLQFETTEESEVSFYLTDGTHDAECVKKATVPAGKQTLNLKLNLFDIYKIVVKPTTKG